MNATNTTGDPITLEEAALAYEKSVDDWLYAAEALRHNAQLLNDVIRAAEPGPCTPSMVTVRARLYARGNDDPDAEPVAVHQWTLSDADLDALEKDFPEGWASFPEGWARVDGDIDTYIIAAVDDLLYAGYDPDTLINSTTSPVPVEVRTHDGPVRLTTLSVEEHSL